MILTVIESPFGTRPDGTRCTPEEMARNVRYLKRAIFDSLSRGEAPFASHGFYPLVLDDATPVERELGIKAGLAWGAKAGLCAVYIDMGETSGMTRGIARHVDNGLRIAIRRIGVEP